MKYFEHFTQSQIRELNYAPELFMRKNCIQGIPFLGGELGILDIGYMHQSNGQIQELSRSYSLVPYA